MFKIESTPDWNRDRLLGYLIYHYSMQMSWDIDPAYPALNHLQKENNLTEEQFIWLSWLYGQTYCTPTTYYIFSAFPDFEDIDNNKFNKWHTNNWKKLLYATDKRHEKGKLFETYLSYKKVLNGVSQQELINKLIDSDPMESYNNIQHVFSDVKGFGRLSVFMFAEALKRWKPEKYNIDCITRDAIGSQSSCNGLCYVSSNDNLLDNKPTKFMDKHVEELLIVLRQFVGDKIAKNLLDKFVVETTLCAYKGLFKKRRYLGYYIDRQNYEIKTMEKNTDFDYQQLWDFRSDVFLHGYLGELNGWKGIRKEKQKVWKEENKLFDLEPLVKEGIIEFGDERWKTRRNLTLSSF